MVCFLFLLSSGTMTLEALGSGSVVWALRRENQRLRGRCSVAVALEGRASKLTPTSMATELKSTLADAAALLATVAPCAAVAVDAPMIADKPLATVICAPMAAMTAGKVIAPAPIEAKHSPVPSTFTRIGCSVGNSVSHFHVRFSQADTSKEDAFMYACRNKVGLGFGFGLTLVETRCTREGLVGFGALMPDLGRVLVASWRREREQVEVEEELKTVIIESDVEEGKEMKMKVCA